MWRLSLMLLGTGLIAWIAYMSALQPATRPIWQHTRLKLDLYQVHSQLLDRTQPNLRFGFISQQLHYDDATQQTLMTPFTFSAQDGDIRFNGSSHSAVFDQNQLRLQGEVSIVQQDTQQQRTFYGQHLLVDWDKHLLHSPTPIELSEGEHHISAGSLHGNYQQGWYEFTDHVQTSYR